jgi:hypothetical protein
MEACYRKIWRSAPVSPFKGDKPVYFDGLLHTCHILFRQKTDTIGQTDFTYRSQLIRHSFVFLTFNYDISLTGIQLIYIRPQRYHLQPIEIFIAAIVADNDNRSLLTDRTTDRCAEAAPAYLTVFHRRYLQASLRTIREPQLRTLHPEPFVDRPSLILLQPHTDAIKIR